MAVVLDNAVKGGLSRPMPTGRKGRSRVLNVPSGLGVESVQKDLKGFHSFSHCFEFAQIHEMRKAAKCIDFNLRPIHCECLQFL